MDSVSKVAIELARRVVPDEIHQAQLIAENFVKGGKARKELLQHNKADELGGFGAGEAAMLPWIFHAINVAAPFLAGFLASKAAANATIISREIRSVLDNGRKPISQHQAQSDQLQHPSSSPPQGHIVPKQLQQCVEAMTEALQKAGLSTELSERVAYKVILILWEDAPNAMLFLQKITERK